MQPHLWLERWRRGQIGFHQTSVDERLQAYWPALNLSAPARVFVPMCGKSLDLLWLRGRGHEVVGVELSAQAVESFFMENGVAATRRRVGSLDLYESDALQIWRGDIFDLTPALLGEIAAVYDRGALIAWEPEQRPPYVAHVTALSAPGTEMLLSTVEFPPSQMSGPPFPVARREVEVLYAPRYSIVELHRLEADIGPRYTARGLKELQEVYYRLTLDDKRLP